MLERKRFFNSLAREWDDFDRPGREKFLRVVKECEALPGQSILDVGSGTGVLIEFLLEETGGESAICAIDYAEEMVRVMETRKYPPNVSVKQADIHRTDFSDNEFDRVIANSCFPHFEAREKVLKEIFRILKPGGIFIISHPDGREAVNRHHGKIECVSGDMLPPARVLSASLQKAGFACEKYIDEDGFYLIKCRKPG